MLSKEAIELFGEDIKKEYDPKIMYNEYKRMARAVKKCYCITQIMDVSMSIGALVTKYPLDDNFCARCFGLLDKIRDKIGVRLYDKIC